MNELDPSPGTRVGTTAGRIGTIRELLDPGPEDPPQEPDEWLGTGEREDLPEDVPGERAVVAFDDGDTEEIPVSDLHPVVEVVEWEWTQREPETAVITGYDAGGTAVVERTLVIESTDVRAPTSAVPWQRSSTAASSWELPMEFVAPVDG